MTNAKEEVQSLENIEAQVLYYHKGSNAVTTSTDTVTDDAPDGYILSSLWWELWRQYASAEFTVYGIMKDGTRVKLAGDTFSSGQDNYSYSTSVSIGQAYAKDIDKIEWHYKLSSFNGAGTPTMGSTVKIFGRKIIWK